MDHRNFDYRNDGTVRRHAHNDTEGGRVVIASEMECEALIRSNRARAENLKTKGETFRPVASIPLPLAERMMQEGTFNDDDAMKKWLNDPDNRAFRIWGGRI